MTPGGRRSRLNSGGMCGKNAGYSRDGGWPGFGGPFCPEPEGPATLLLEPPEDFPPTGPGVPGFS